MFRIEQNRRMKFGRPKPQIKGSSAPDDEEDCPSHSSLSFLACLFIRVLSWLYSLLFLSCLCFLLRFIRVMVFSLIRGFLGCCFNFPNVSIAAAVIACFPLLICICCLSLHSSNFALTYYCSSLFPFLPFVC